MSPTSRPDMFSFFFYNNLNKIQHFLHSNKKHDQQNHHFRYWIWLYSDLESAKQFVENKTNEQVVNLQTWKKSVRELLELIWKTLWAF